MVIKKMKLLASNAAQLESESAFDVLARAQRRASAGHPVINLGIGQPDFQTSAHIVEAAVKALQDGQHGYTAAAGTVELRSGVAAYYERCFGLDVDPESVLVVPGGKVTMAFAMLLLGESGREILSPDPGFPIYRSMAGYSGARAVPYALHEEMGFSFKAEDILARVEAGEGRVHHAVLGWGCAVSPHMRSRGPEGGKAPWGPLGGPVWAPCPPPGPTYALHHVSQCTRLKRPRRSACPPCTR